MLCPVVLLSRWSSHTSQAATCRCNQQTDELKCLRARQGKRGTCHCASACFLTATHRCSAVAMDTVPFLSPPSCWWIWRDGAGEKRWSWLYCPCVIFIPVQLRVAPLPFSPSFSSTLLSHPLICTLLDLPAFVSASASVHHTSSLSSLPLSLALSAGAVCFPCVVDPGRLSRTSVGSEERQR